MIHLLTIDSMIVIGFQAGSLSQTERMDPYLSIVYPDQTATSFIRHATIMSMECHGCRDQDITVTACIRKFAGMIHNDNQWNE